LPRDSRDAASDGQAETVRRRFRENPPQFRRPRL